MWDLVVCPRQGTNLVLELDGALQLPNTERRLQGNAPVLSFPQNPRTKNCLQSGDSLKRNKALLWLIGSKGHQLTVTKQKQTKVKGDWAIAGLWSHRSKLKKETPNQIQDPFLPVPTFKTGWRS